MLSNNVKSFIVHILIDFVCLLIFEIQEEFIGYKVNILGNSEKSYSEVRLILALTIFIFAIFLYYTLSKRFLDKFTAKVNVLSVLVVFIIGIILWLVGYILYPQDKNLGGGFLKLYYQIYNAYCLPLISALSINNSYLSGVFAIIPSLFMWIGIQSKSNEKRALTKKY